jgi:tetratricopeptide (TPR) repeat protein
LLQGELSRERFGSSALPAVFSRAYMAFSLADLGECSDAISIAQEAVRIAEEADTAHSQVIAAHALGLAYLCKGDLALALPVLEQTLHRCQVGHIPLGTRLLASALGYAYALSGRIADAVLLLEQALQQAEALNVVFRYALWLAWLGEAYLLAGRQEDALACAGRAAGRARTHKEPGHEAYALRLFGEIYAYHAPPAGDKAETHYRQALALADNLGMRPLVAHCHLGLGTLYAKTERLEHARSELSIAIALYRAMEMTFWLPQAEAKLAQVEGR